MSLTQERARSYLLAVALEMTGIQPQSAHQVPDWIEAGAQGIPLIWSSEVCVPVEGLPLAVKFAPQVAIAGG
jgi:hypothetical protein